MAGTYSLGVFNDNFFKQAVIILAVYWMRETGEDMSWVKGLAAAFFAVPYVLFAAYAGYLADRFSKRNIIIGAKIWELAAMLCGAVGICTGSWTLMLGMVFMMGFQSAVFGPALNGSIPELYPASYVTTANAILKGAVTVSILLGIVLAGYVLKIEWVLAGIKLDRLTVACIAVGVSVAGVLASLAVPRRPAADPHARFPRTGPAITFNELREIHRDPLLGKIVWAAVFVWFVGSLQILIISVLGERQLGVDEAVTSNLMFAELVGIAIGGGIAVKLAKGPKWHRVLAPTALALGLLALAMPIITVLPVASRVWFAAGLLLLTGTAGGMFMIPCESFIQVRPAAEKKGAVIAASNCAVFCGIILSGLLDFSLGDKITPSTFFAATAAVSLPASWLLWRSLRKHNGGDMA